MIIVAVLAFALTVLAVCFHVACLKQLSRGLVHCRRWPLLGPAVILLGAIVAHLFEIGVFGWVFAVLAMSGTYGSISGDIEFGSLNYFFLSAETYTALGYSGNTPTGPLRLLAASEALTGLVLITWTASLGFTAMQTCWETTLPGENRQTRNPDS